jgi:uncharacterized membrane protein YbhN (UPF0104 family)
VGAFLHALHVFFDHLAAVKWTPLAIALGLHVLKLVFRAIAWRSILRAAYPEHKLKLRSAFGAYVAGVGVNSVAPARGGDLVKLYLIKHRLPESSYATLTPTLLVETVFDIFVAGALMVWALSLGVLPTHDAYSRLPTVDWKYFLRHEELTAEILVALALAALVLLVWARRRVSEFWDRVSRGFAILRDRKRFLRAVILPQAISWGFRLGSIYFFLQAFGVHATLHNALLVQVVDSLATLFPATPGGAGTKQGLIVVLFKNEAVSRTLLVAFSVGMNVALVVCNLVLGLAALALMARTLSWKRLRLAQRKEQEQAA